MRILLINPPFYRFVGLEQDYIPLSLMAVGSAMADKGNLVFLKNLEIGSDLHYEGYSGRSENYDKYLHALYNHNPIWDELDKAIEETNPSLIGINVLSVKYRSAIKMIKSTWGRNIRIVVGGHHVMNDPWWPPGVEVFKGEYESYGKRMTFLDELPFPNYDILMDEYSPDGYSHITTSRGCPYSCRFCASCLMWNRKVTYKSADRIIGEMRYIYNRYKTNCFTIWDEVFTLNKYRLFEFCDKYNLPAHWRCDTRADLITEEKIIRMKNSGMLQISIGVESGDNDILDKINKKETTEDYIKAADILNKHNIQWKAYCIIGFPYDTEETIFKTIEFIKSLNPSRITISFFTPYQGTEMYEESKGTKLIGEGYETAAYSHQSPYNYFCPNIPKKRYFEIRNAITKDIDNYNSSTLKVWK